jgi:L,D-transpeptidase-like protein
MKRESLNGTNRRSAVGLLLVATGFLFCGRYLVTGALAKPSRKRTTAQSKQPAAKGPAQLKPGQFEWHPERSPDGPIAIIISVPKQRVYVYRNGIQIAVSTCSTGKEGYETPTGVFTILQKE